MATPTPPIPPASGRTTDSGARRRYILRAVIGYGIFAALWILLSDALMAELMDIQAMQWLSTAKGLLFVVVTTLLLLVALRNVPDQESRVPAALWIAETMVSAPGRRAWIYAFAVLASVAMLLVRSGIAIAFSQRPLMILFVFPVILSAMVGGFGPGLVATVVSGLSVAYYLTPSGSFRIAEAHDLFQWSFFLVNGVLVSVLAERLFRLRRESEANRLLQAVTLASIGDGVIVADARGCVTFFNPEAERLTGWRCGEAMGQPIAAVFAVVNEESRLPLEDPVQKVLSTGQVVGLAKHTLLIRRDGQELPVVDSGAPIRLDNGTLAGVVLVFRDDTSRRQAEMVLQQERGFLKTLIQTLPDLVWLKDPQGVYLTCNARFERFFGASESEVAGKTDYDFVDQELADFFRQKDREAIAKGGPAVNEEEVTSIADGHREILSTIKTPMYDAQGDLIGVLGIARDVTAVRKAEKALRVQDEMLRDMSAMARIGGWSFDPATGQGSWTEEVARIHELDPVVEPTVQFGLDFYRPGESRERIETALREAIELGKAYDLELELISAQGNHKWVRTMGAPVIEDGKVVLMRGTLQDITAHKEIEAALRRSEATYRSLFTNMLNSVVHCRMIFDGGVPVDYEYLTVNPAFAEVTGITAPVVGRRISEIIPGYCQNNPESLEIFGGVATSGVPARWEHYLADLDRWFAFSIYSPASGEVVIVTENITERKIAELALRESEKTYRSLFENMLNGFAYCRMIFEHGRPRDFVYLNVNHAFETLTGLKDVVGRRVSEVIPDLQEADPDLFEIYGRVAMGGAPERFEVYVKALEMWFAVSVYSPQSEHFVAVFDVITARKKAESALRESEKRFRDIAEISADWIWEVDSAFCFTFASSSVGKALGYSVEELIGRRPFELMPPEEAARVGEAANAIAAQAESFRDLDNLTLHKDGSLRHLLTSGVPILDDRGELLGYRGLNRDITGQRQAELALRQSLEEKIALLKEVHHRVKNNLQIVASLLSLQVNQTKAPDAVAALLDTRNRVHSMALLHEVLYRSGNLARINLAVYVEGLCTQLLRSIGQAAGRVQVERRIGPISLPLDQAVPCGLIINELVTNALKYAFPEGKNGQVVVEVAAEAGRVALAVGDNGMGLPVGFDPAASSTLGLQLVMKLAGQLGGQLAWESAPGGGVRFRVDFPMPETDGQGDGV